jgi:hypothetical protein
MAPVIWAFERTTEERGVAFSGSWARAVVGNFVSAVALLAVALPARSFAESVSPVASAKQK